MTYVTVSGDCIDRVTAQNGTPRPAPKVTLKRNWQSQQQHEQQPQQPILDKDVTGVWKQRATWESPAEVQDDSKHITETNQAPGNWIPSTSQMDVDTHLGDKEVSTDAFSNNEAVKAELTDTNTKAIEIIKTG